MNLSLLSDPLAGLEGRELREKYGEEPIPAAVTSQAAASSGKEIPPVPVTAECTHKPFGFDTSFDD